MICYRITTLTTLIMRLGARLGKAQYFPNASAMITMLNVRI